MTDVASTDEVGMTSEDVRRLIRRDIIAEGQDQ